MPHRHTSTSWWRLVPGTPRLTKVDGCMWTACFPTKLAIIKKHVWRISYLLIPFLTTYGEFKQPRCVCGFVTASLLGKVSPCLNFRCICRSDWAVINRMSSNESNLSLQWTLYRLYCHWFHDLSIFNMFIRCLRKPKAYTEEFPNLLVQLGWYFVGMRWYEHGCNLRYKLR